MWKNAASWACLLANPTVAKEKKKSKLKEAMAHCAVVNIKKENGKSKSSHADLAIHFESNKSDLLSEIETINPQIIITGGTFRYLVKLFEGITPVTGGELEDNIGFYQTADKKLIVRLRHPSFPKATSDAYYELIQSKYQKIYPRVKNW
jgi:tRNA A37 N6-isopentenylltransferase MiaA